MSLFLAGPAWLGGLTGLVAAMTLSPQASIGYLLPYPADPPRQLIQGNNGPYGHVDHARYAFDFLMPIGSPVLAARDGSVLAIEEGFDDGTRKGGQENFVMILHSDSTIGRYYHLTKSGALVIPGDKVAAGDTIGRSGNSGASAGPHLHFDVTQRCREWGCQTIPIRFRNAGADSLVAGTRYPRTD